MNYRKDVGASPGTSLPSAARFFQRDKSRYHRSLYRFDRYPAGFADVKAGGRDGFSVHSRQTNGVFSLTVELNPRGAAGADADWRLRAVTPGGMRIWYTRERSWVPSVFPLRAHAGPLQSIGPRTVLETDRLPRGRWQFDLAVDKMDGIPQWSACDTVGVLVEP